MRRVSLPRIRDDALALDAGDELSALRGEFLLPEGVIYLDGNSLGPLPRATIARLEQVIGREWGEDLIRSWSRHGWIDLPLRVGDAIAPLIGAQPGEAVAADSTSVNLYKLLAASAGLRPDRRVLLSEEENFPTDLYVAQGFAALLGEERLEVRLVPRARIAEALGADVAVLLLTHVEFRTGEMHDLAAMTAAAHDAGALVVWDLSHSAGAAPVDLGGSGADMAAGCGYKYLNGGPGAPAFVYVRRDLQDQVLSPIQGWMGHDDPFAFEHDYRPAPGIARFLCGTPPILSLAALECGVALVTQAGILALRRKSLALTELFIARVERECAGFDLALASPREGARRGSQVSFRHPQAYALVQALIADGVIGDFRAPDLMRFGLSPSFLRFVDVWDAVERLKAILS
jgi:kynureninase